MEMIRFQEMILYLTVEAAGLGQHGGSLRIRIMRPGGAGAAD